MALRCVVLDIEGTTSSTSFVHGTLFPYSVARFGPWIAEHRHEPRVQEQLAAVRAALGDPDAGEERCVAQLEAWVADDVKATPLKAIQGWIWDEGFAAGDLTSHFYPDVIPALRRWADAGLQLSVFSSGSVSAQQAWFGHSPDGDLLALFGGRLFDTENAGPKKEAASYRRIAEALGRPAAELVFLSDVVAELDAARQAGWCTVGVRRPGDAHYDAGVGDHLEVSTFDHLDLTGKAPRLA
jgi:enolase-phosphatase E1